MAGCSNLAWPVQGNTTLISHFNTVLSEAYNGSFAFVENNAALFCASDSNTCFGICPNADVAGVGVRAAFYLNAIMTASLVVLSPADSPGAAWSSTILTAAMIIPAIIQKKQRMLSLYHATLVLNFATFSSIVSLAVAPLCPIWRKIDNKEHPKHIRTPPNRTQELPTSGTPPPHFGFPAWGQSTNASSPGVEADAKVARQRSRIVLSFALIAQVSLQWSWATYLFTSPYYAQTSCNPITTVVMFLVPLTGRQINTKYFGVWAVWLLFSMFSTFAFGVLLVLSSTSGVHNVRVGKHFRRPRHRAWLMTRIRQWDPEGDKRRRAIFVLAFLLCLLFVIDSEVQAHKNCLLLGENNQWGFEQLAAMLFALAPVWPIAISLRERNFSLRETLEKMFRPRLKNVHNLNAPQSPLLFSGSPESLHHSRPTSTLVPETPLSRKDSSHSFVSKFNLRHLPSLSARPPTPAPLPAPPIPPPAPPDQPAQPIVISVIPPSQEDFTLNLSPVRRPWDDSQGVFQGRV